MSDDERLAKGLHHVSTYVDRALAKSGILDMAKADTTPGSACVLAPPAGTDLTTPQYLDLMRKRYRIDIQARAHMRVYARRLLDLTIVGPFAEEARNMLGKIGA